LVNKKIIVFISISVLILLNIFNCFDQNDSGMDYKSFKWIFIDFLNNRFDDLNQKNKQNIILFENLKLQYKSFNQKIKINLINNQFIKYKDDLKKIDSNINFDLLTNYCILENGNLKIVLFFNQNYNKYFEWYEIFVYSNTQLYDINQNIVIIIVNKITKIYK
jgi:hypothetical protein